MWLRALKTLVSPVCLAALVPTFALALLVAVPLQAQQCVFCGDVNGDGQVDIVDALFIAQNTVGLRDALACTAQGDVRPDQSVDIVDALFIAQFTVGTRPILCFRIDAPAQQSLFATSPIQVSGALTGQASVACNGIGATVGSGTFAATVPLQEGNTTLACVAQESGGHVATATESVTLDTTPPRVVIGSPADGSTVSASPIAVTGVVNDVVVGTVNGGQATVSCNGVDAQISNRTFAAPGITLTEGVNTITCTSTDRAGNLGSATITVKLDTSPHARINQVSGDLQSGAIGTALVNPLVVSLTDDAGHPVPGKPVIFKVLQNDGTVDGGGMSGRSVAVTTNTNGQAQAQFTLGTRAGRGNNQVQASALGFDGQAIFCATATTAPAARIVVDSGNNQHGPVAQALPLPFTAIVIDQGNNRLPSVPVTFAITQGGSSFSGQPAVTLNTDSDGRAQAVLTLGSAAGINNNTVEVSFAGNTSAPAVFVASGEIPGDPANTSVSGVVLDNTNSPVPGASLIVAGTTLSTISDQQGQFRITGVPVALVRLFVDGSTVQRPDLAQSRVHTHHRRRAGQHRRARRCLPLAPRAPGAAAGVNQICVDATHGGTITLPEVPGFSFTVPPGSATFPNGLKTGCVTATPVHPDKMPKLPNFGQQPRFAVTIQPAGTLFNPPAPIAIPNADNLPPGQKTDMYSYDHELEQFVSIGTGTVSDDGTVVQSDPGIGVIKAGWHCGGNPQGSGGCGNECDDHDECTTDTPCPGVNTPCCVYTPVPDGTPCSDSDQSFQADCPFATGAFSNQVNIRIDDSCRGQCEGGKCTNSPFGIFQMINTAFKVVESDICEPPAGASCIGDTLRAEMAICLANRGFNITCAYRLGSDVCAVKATIAPDCDWSSRARSRSRAPNDMDAFCS